VLSRPGGGPGYCVIAKEFAMTAIELANLEESALMDRMARALADSVLGRGFFQSWATDSWRPEVNLYETRSTFVVCADLAGMDQRSIEVSLAVNQLIIRGRRACPMPGGKEKAVAVHLMEIDHGSFSRTVEIPGDVDECNISAHYEAGMLWVTLHKMQ
jgi:HSP20 family protein